MHPVDPHRHSRQIRRFKPRCRHAGAFPGGVMFLDVALALLGFFLVSSPFVKQPGINLQLPRSPFTGGARFGSMLLSISHDGAFFYRDERMDSERLYEVLAQAVAEDEKAVLIIEADERARHGAVVEAWNAALAAGVAEISLATSLAAKKEARDP